MGADLRKPSKTSEDAYAIKLGYQDDPRYLEANPVSCNGIGRLFLHCYTRQVPVRMKTPYCGEIMG